MRRGGEERQNMKGWNVMGGDKGGGEKHKVGGRWQRKKTGLWMNSNDWLEEETA